jgi:hypothetical protein
MRKIALTLCLSFLIGIVNASTMPVLSTGPMHDAQASTHSHCEQAPSEKSHGDTQPAGKLPISHYCCSVIAVLGGSISFETPISSSFFPIGAIASPISNITEALYKPPKNYL